MPTIEGYRGGPTPSYRLSSPSDFADTQGLTDMAGALGAIGEKARALQDERNRSEATRLASESRVYWLEQQDKLTKDPDFNRKYGVDGSHIYETTKSDFDAYAKGVLEQYPNNPYLSDQLDRIKLDVLSSSSGMQARYTANYVRTNYTQTLDNYEKLARSNPATAEEALRSYSGLVGSSTLIDQNQKNELIFDAQSRIREASLMGSIEQNPDIALQILGETKSQRNLQMNAPIGIRQNNPLNLRPSKDKWQGVVGESKGYLVFDTPEAGIRAAAKNLQSYKNYGIDTIEEVIARWAPASDNNDPVAYANTVSKLTGIPKDQPIDLADKGVLMRILPAMIQVENGKGYITQSELDAGVNAASGGPLRITVGKQDVEAAGLGAKLNGLSYDAQERVLRFASVTFNRREADAERARADYVATRKSEHAINVELAKQNDDMSLIEDGLAEVDKDFAAGVLDEKTANEQRLEYLKAYGEINQSVGDLNTGKDILSGARENTMSDADKKAVNLVFEKSIMPFIADKSPLEQATVISQATINAKFVPEAVGDLIRQSATTNDPERLKLASDVIRRVTSEAPQMQQYINEKDSARVQMMSDLVDSGVSFSDARQKADELVGNPKLFSARKEAYEIVKKSADFKKRATDNFQWWANHTFGIIGSHVDTSTAVSAAQADAMGADYENVFKQHYLLTGDENLSDEYAKKVIGGKYGLSLVNQVNQVMMFPPESQPAYRVEGLSQEENAEWIRGQAVDLARERYTTINKDGVVGGDFDPERVFIDAHPTKTKQTAENGAPVYALKYINDLGVPINLLERNEYWLPERAKMTGELIKRAQERLKDPFWQYAQGRNAWQLSK